jgi:MFS family permease
MTKEQKNFIAGIIGNILDRYDMAIYGLMAAFIAPNFFPSSDPIVGVIKTYGVMALGLFTRPFGALIFGKMAMNLGSRRVMVICLSGVAITTGAIGLIPSYDKIGSAATLIFVLTRILQGIFASGENTVAPFFVIQNSPSQKATRSSAYYNCSTMIGVVMASVAATIVSYSPDPNFYWRIAFVFGFATGILGIILRFLVVSDLEESRPDFNLKKVFKLVFIHKSTIYRIMLVSSFSYITYTVPFVFMNSFVPEVTNIKIGEMLQLNSVLLVLDTALIPIFGIFAESYDRAKFMALMSGFVAITVIPLFYFIQGADFIYVMFVRLIIIIAGLAYLAPLQAWYYSLFTGSERYLLVGVGYSLGEEILGRNSTAICLWLWYYFKHPAAPAFYICFVATMATIALTIINQKQQN